MEKTATVVPLGLMSGNHVTPVDHQYFQNFDNQEPDIEVYAPGDGVVTSIQHMFGSYESGGDVIEWADFRVVIEHTCTISSIYIHIDVLADKIASQAPAKGEHASVKIPVEAGEVIGWYASNVDYNIVDEEVVLPGLLVPEHYASEPWKIHVPDTLLYFNEPVKSEIIAKSLRTVEPISGKFDHDVDGRLVGNWFLEGTNGYAGSSRHQYWVGHLSVSPDYLDPEHIIVSLGDFEGRQEQFGVAGNAPDPADVDVDHGLVEWELVSYEYYAGGSPWDRRTLAKDITAMNTEFVEGVVLFQLVEPRRLKVEVFPDATALQVEGFTENARFYER